MNDVSWVVETSHQIRPIFENMFYLFVTVLLLLGVLIEYFKLPLGGVPAFAPLVGRALVAFLLLESYTEIANFLGQFSDALAADINQTTDLLAGVQQAWDKIQAMDWGWTSLGQTLIWFLGYIVYAVLYLSVFFFDAALLYVWVICYVLSPLLIGFFVLPQTSGATKALYRTIIEVSAWKVVFAVIAALLWQSSLSQLDPKATDNPNFIVTIAYMLMLSLSLLLTPLVVRAFMSPGISGLTGMAMVGAAAIGSGGLLSPAGMKAIGVGATKKGFSSIGKGVGKSVSQGTKWGLHRAGLPSRSAQHPSDIRRPNKEPAALREPKWVKAMNRDIPLPTAPPGWLEKQLQKEQSQQNALQANKPLSPKPKG